MKKILKYQLLDLKNTFIVFYLVYASLFIFSAIAVDKINFSIMGKSFSINGLEFSGIIIAFVIGLAMFKEHFWLLSQNGVSRQMFFRCSLVSALIFSVGMSFVNFIIALLLNMIDSIHYISLIQLIYPNYNGVIANMINMLYSVIIFFFSFVIGLFLSMCFYKANKFVKVLIAAGIPVFLFMIAPMTFTFMSDFWLKLFDISLLIMGLKHGNPFIGILTLSIASVAFILISRPIMKRTNII